MARHVCTEAEAQAKADRIVKPVRRMIATVTEQGTAMSESALCSLHDTPDFRRLYGEPDAFIDCTGNDQLWCNVCGWPEGGDEDSRD